MLLASDLLLTGTILLISMYHLGLFFLRKQETYALYFALFALMLVGYKITTGEYFLMMLFPDLPWSVMLRVFFLSVCFSIPFFVMFLYRLYPEESIKFLLYIFLGSSSILIVFILFFRAAWLEYALYVVEPIALATCVYSVIVFFRAALHDREGARGFIAGIMFFFATVVNDILFERDIVKTEVYAPIGLFVLLFSHSTILLRRFTNLIETVEYQKLDIAKTAALKEKLYRADIQSRRMQLEMLKKAIQPHFLINSLAAIRAWLLEDPQKSAKLLDDFSDEMRIIQSVSGKEKICILEEISLCRLHMQVMAMRREKHYRFYTRGIEGSEKIPPMIFHTMMENAFTHDDTENGSLNFYLIKNSIHTEGGCVTRYVFLLRNPNPGPPRPARKGNGVGLRYIRTRLEESYPGAWSMDH
ncbi:MAG TPA: 7TM diverse intracellular signaling domain-containing protein, partial [Leptospiraceae bacterium]|nr:7TM diverse intracellular signaling domain-containing protein [Leptospiraceae bacterium]